MGEGLVVTKRPKLSDTRQIPDTVLSSSVEDDAVKSSSAAEFLPAEECALSIKQSVRVEDIGRLERIADVEAILAGCNAREVEAKRLYDQRQRQLMADHEQLMSIIGHERLVAQRKVKELKRRLS